MTLAYIEVLKPYTMAEIESAFKIWLEDETVMPSPAQIKSVVLKYRAPASTAQQEVEHPSYHQLPPEQRAEIDKVLQATKVKLEGPKAAAREVSEPNFKHWERLSEEQKAEIYAGLKVSVKTVTHGSVNG